MLLINYALGAMIAALAIYFYVPFNKAPIPGNAQASNEQALAQKIYNDCHAKQDWDECYKQELSDLTREQGLPLAQSVLFSIQNVDQNSRNCHVIAHFMAREAYKRDPTHWLDLADQADINSCGGGFLHGILEAHINDTPSQQVSASFADEVCTRKPDDYRERLCYHLFGHFFLVDENGQLNQALPLCGQIGQAYQYDCYDGLFMEDHQKLSLADHGLAQLPNYTPDYLNSLEKQCLGQSGTQASACWTEIAEVVAKTYGYNDPQVIYKECYKAQNLDDQQNCYLKGVVVLSIYEGYDTAPKLLSICANYQGSEYMYNRCTAYIVSSLMHYSDKYIDRGITLCSNINTADRQQCFGELVQQLHQVAAASELPGLCQGMPADIKAMCLN